MTKEKLQDARKLELLIEEKERTIATIEEIKKNAGAISGGMLEVIVNATPNPQTPTILLDQSDILDFIDKLLITSQEQLRRMKQSFEEL